MSRQLRIFANRPLQLTHISPMVPLSTHKLRIRVISSPVNALDRAMQGGYTKSIFPQLLSVGLVPGRECVGIVDQVGSGVWDWRVGDKVVVGISAMNGDGCHADIVDVYPSCTARISTKHFDQFTVEEWASVGFTGVCARIAAEHALKSASLKSVAVVGGAGATGSFVIQMIRKRWENAQIWTSCSRSEGVAYCKDVLGANDAMDHDDLIEKLERGEIQVDWIIDCGTRKILDTSNIIKDFRVCKIFNGIQSGGGFSSLNADLVKNIDQSGSLISGLPLALRDLAHAKAICSKERGIQFHWAVHEDRPKDLVKLVEEIQEGNLFPPKIGMVANFDEIGILDAYNYSGMGKAVLRM